MQKYTKNTYIPEYFSDSTYSNLSGNSTPSGSTKVTPDSLETTIEVLLWLKNPFDFNLPIGATDILIGPTNLVGSLFAIFIILSYFLMLKKLVLEQILP